jgi:virginiamycin B lyase
MRSFAYALAALAALLATPLAADIGGVTVSPVNLPAQASEMTIGTDGNLWLITFGGKIGKLTPAGTYTEYSLPFTVDQFNIPFAQTLTFGPDKNLWVVATNGHIERITTAGTVTDFTVAPSFYPRPLIVSGPDNALWFFDRPAPAPGASFAWKLGRIDVFGNVTAYDLGISGDSLAGLVSGDDGNLWLINETKNQVVKFSLATNSVAATFAIPSQSNGADDKTVAAWDGNIWFTRGTSIDRVTRDGTITEFPVPSGGKPAAILMAGDGNIWFTEPVSGRIGQLVISTTTINESATGIAPGVYEFFLLPPSFAGSTVASHSPIRAEASNPCPGITFLAPDSDTGKTSNVVLAVRQCADIFVGLPVAQQRGTAGLRITARIGNNGPDGATAFMIVAMNAFFQFNIASAVFANVPAARCDLNQPQANAVECEIPLMPGEAHDVNIDLDNLSVSSAQAAIFTRVSGFSDLFDPDLSNNVQVRLVTLKSVATLPAPTTPVATPVLPPGFKPCVVNAGSVGAVGPCFGPPGTTLTLEMSKTVPGGPGSLVFKTVVVSGGPADVIVPVTPVAGSATVFSATAPPTLCAGPFPHTWNVWLSDATGGSQGEIGQFSITSCP